MGGDGTGGESHALRGPIDRAALLGVRDVVATEGPLATAQLDEFLDPSVLEIDLAEGLLGAETARIDVRWTTRGDYSVHYTDSRNVNVRWDRHPRGGDYANVSGLEHYHPPPNASSDPADVEDSCIEQRPAKLVARAVVRLWRVAYHADSLVPLNAGRNPP